MSKAFTKESDGDDDDDVGALPPLPAGGKNYITPQGYQRIKDELLDLIDNERPKIVEIVHWAASNGDRSENGDYLYGKKRLREIDRRIRFLTKRLEIVEEPDIFCCSPKIRPVQLFCCPVRESILIIGVFSVNGRKRSPFPPAIITTSIGRTERSFSILYISFI